MNSGSVVAPLKGERSIPLRQVVESGLSASLETVAVLLDEGGEYSLRVHKAGEKPPEEDDGTSWRTRTLALSPRRMTVPAGGPNS